MHIACSFFLFVFLMILRPPRSSLILTLFPYTTLFRSARRRPRLAAYPLSPPNGRRTSRSEEHTSELQSHSEISYAVFCLKKKTHIIRNTRSSIYTAKKPKQKRQTGP